MVLSDNSYTPLIITFLSGMSTVIGAFLVIFLGEPSFEKLGHMLSFATGVMMYISFLDLLPEAVNTIGYFDANLYFFLGMLFFLMIVKFIPEPEISTHSHDSDENGNEKENEKEKKKRKRK